MSAPRLMHTANYELFEMHELNRPLHSDPGLEESMRAHGFLPQFPIACVLNGNGKLKIFAGHHRFATAKRLNIPVYYVVAETEVDPHELEGRKQMWSMNDHVRARTAAGQTDYVLLCEFADAHGLPLGVATALVGGQGASSKSNFSKAVYSGTFRVGDMSHARQVVEVTDELHSIGISFARSTSFVQAVSAAIRVPEFDPRQLVQRARLYPGHMSRRGTVDECLQEIEGMYNYTSKSNRRLALAFRAKEIGKERARTFGRGSVPLEGRTERMDR